MGVKLPGGSSSTLLESPELATLSTECSSSGPLALGPSVNAAGPRLNQGGCDDRRVAVNVRLNPPETAAAEEIRKEAKRAIAGNIAAALALGTKSDMKDDVIMSAGDGEQVYKDSLCEPMEVLRLAQEAEQEALHEMEEAMNLMRQVTKRRMEEMTAKNAKGYCSSGSNRRCLVAEKAGLPADSLRVPPGSSTKAATKELQAADPELQRLARRPQQHGTDEDPWNLPLPGSMEVARSPLQQACGKRHGHQAIPENFSMHQRAALQSNHATQHAESSEERSFHRTMQASRTPQIREESTDHDGEIVAHGRVRSSKRARHAVVLDSTQVVSGTVSCPFASFFVSICDLCLLEEVPGPKANQVEPIIV